MPLLNRKRVPLMEAIPYDPKKKRKDVWYLRFTNEVFTNYESYIHKLSLYQQSIWECEVTGRQNLTYEQALESEKGEMDRVEYKFDEVLRKDILLRIQFQTVHLDELVDNIYTYYNRHYVTGEVVGCTLFNYEYYAQILECIPLQSYWKQPQPSPSDSSGSISSIEDDIHRPTGRLRFPDGFLIDTDHVDTQRYRVQLLTSEGQPLENGSRIISEECLHRNELYSRRNIQTFIRECCHREHYPNAPWKIKSDIGAAYNMNPTLPEECPEDKSKKRKMTDEKGADKRARKEEQSVTKARLKEERERQKRERKKQAVKYPVEDLDLPIYRKDPGLNWLLIDMSPHKCKEQVIPYPSGGRPLRPPSHHDDIIPPALYDSFLAVWTFLTVYAEPLKIATYSISDFQSALFHTSHQPKATVLIEYNACLINAIIQERREDTLNEIINGDFMESYILKKDTEEICTRRRKDRLEMRRGWRDKEQLRISQKWDSKELRANYERRGWETALIGCLNDIATPDMIPDLDSVLLHMVPKSNTSATDREKHYMTLNLKQKLDILVFLVDVVNESLLIKNYMDHCQEQLSEFRKQKVELNKESKQLILRRSELDRKDRADRYDRYDKDKEDKESVSDSSDLTDDMSDSSESRMAARERRHQSRQKKMKQKQREREEMEYTRKREYAVQREITKARNHELKQRQEQRRKLEEEEKTLKKKEETLERLMRKYMTLRIRPLGKDRFYNRYFFLDNMGTSDVSSSGRLFIHSPTDVDIEMMIDRDCGLEEEDQPWGHGGGRWFIKALMREQGLVEESDWLEQRMDELSSNNPPPYIGWWRYYSQEEEITQLLAWLNPKGIRENKLKNELMKQLPSLLESIKTRSQLSSIPDSTKRTTRNNAGRSSR